MRHATAIMASLPMLLLACGPAFAHGFGQRYDLPVPLWLYLYGASAAVLLSFIIVAFFVGKEEAPRGYPRFDLFRLGAFRATLGSRAFVAGLRAVSVALFLLVVLCGFFGNQEPILNFAPTFVWIVWWVGMSIFVAFVGNIWLLVNPWKILFEWADKLVRGSGDDGEGIELKKPYPTSWDVWPALVLFFAFVWVELVSGASSTPRNIALFVLVYSSVTWAGMAVFGKETWLRNGEAFSVFFGILARFAPTEAKTPASGERSEVYIRPPAVGLLSPDGVSNGRGAFVVFMLAAVTYDGLMPTPAWVNLLNLLYPVVEPLGRWAAPVYGTLGLTAASLAFLAAYLGFVKLCQILGGGAGFGEVARAFAYSLVPIALAYQVAHYYTLLLVEGQAIFFLASDPFGWGWDIFGTASYEVDVGVVGAAFVWYSQVALIVAGHVVAVYLAHRVALRSAPDAKSAVRSQYPMIALMISYTIFSLWILAQPVAG